MVTKLAKLTPYAEDILAKRKPVALPIERITEPSPPSVDSLKRLYPDMFETPAGEVITTETTPEMVLDTIQSFANDSPDDFLDDIRTMGKNPDTVGLLKYIGLDDTDVYGVFKAEQIVPPKVVEKPAKEGFFKDALDAISEAGASIYDSIRSRFLTLTMNKLLVPVKVGDAKKDWTPAEGGSPRWTKEEVAAENIKVAKDKQEFKRLYENIKTVQEKYRILHPERQPVYSEGFYNTAKSNPKALLDPTLWAEAIGQTLPYTVGLMGIMLAPEIGIPAAFAITFATEGQDIYEDLKASGATDEQAENLAEVFGALSAVVETVGDALFVQGLGKAGGIFSHLLARGVAKEVAKEVIKKTGLQVAKEVVVRALIDFLNQGGQEAVEQVLRNAAVKFVDENRPFLQDVMSSFVGGVVGTIPFVGAGAVGQFAQTQTVQEAIAEAKLAPEKGAITPEPEVTPTKVTPTVPTATTEAVKGITPAPEVAKPKLVRLTPEAEVQTSYQILKDKLTSEGIDPNVIDVALETYGFKTKIDRTGAVLTREGLLFKLQDAAGIEDTIRKLTREILGKKFGVPANEVDLVLEGGSRVRPDIDIAEAKALATKIADSIKRGLPTRKELLSRYLPEPAIPKAEVGMPEAVKYPATPTGAEARAKAENISIAEASRLNAEEALKVPEVPTAPPTEVVPTDVKQTEFVKEYMESKGQKPPPPSEPPTVSTQFSPDMPASQQVANRISFDPDKVSLRERFLRGKNKAMSQWIDKLYPIDKFVDVARKLGVEISLEENPYIQARMLEGVTSKATSFLEDGTFGRKFWKMEKGKAVPNIKGESLSKILEDVKEPQAWRDFSTYLTSLRSLELSNLNIETGIEADVASRAITELEAKYPNFAKLADRIQKYQSDLLDYVQESGLISADLRETLNTKYFAYVPFHRVMEELQGKGYMGKKMVDIVSPIKRIKGSEREIINPLESITKNTYAFISAADRNQIGVMMARLVNANPELQGLFEPIKTPIVKVANVTAKELGIDIAGLSDGDTEEVFNIFHPSMFTKENVATVLIDGKKQFFKVDPDLNTALTAMDTANMGILWKVLSSPAKWLRAGATLNPDFMIRNPLRDAMTATIYSNYGFIPGVDFLKGVASILRKDATYRLYKMSGAEHSMLVSLDRDYLQKTFKEVVEGKKFTDYIKHPLQLLQIASELGEKATRLGEFAKGIKQGVTPLEAGFSSREVTLDFAKAGTQAKAVNRIIAFFNSNIRDPDRMIRAFKEHPIRTAVKAFLIITVPSLLLWMANHDEDRWKEIPQWQKDLFWIVFVGDNIYRIPKPFGLGQLFGSAPERLLDYLETKDPDIIKEFAGNLFESGMPGWLPSGIEPIIENITNYSFFRGIPVVPASEQDLPPELQYTEYTSELAKAMGKFLNYSPMKIDNIIQGWTGGLGRYATEIIDKILQGTGIVAPKIEPSPTLADLPVIRAFVVRNPIGGSSESVSKFYDELDAYTAEEKRLKSLIEDKKVIEFEETKAKHPELLFTYDDETDTYYSASARYLRRVTGELSDIRKLQDKIYASTTMTPEKKRELIDALDQVKTDMANRALELIHNPSREVGILETPVEDIEDKLGVTTGSPLSQDVIGMTDIAPELAQAKGESPLKKLVEKNNTILVDIANLPDQPLYQIDRAVTKAGLTRRQNELLDQYEASTDKKAFLKEHPELKENPKTKWLKDNPESNAILALWGNSKLLTQKAYDIAIGLVESNDIPDNTLGERVLPPKGLAKPYFELMDAKEKWGDSSWEAKLILAKNPKLVEWNPAWELPDTPLQALELKTEGIYRATYDKLSDKEYLDTLDDKVKDENGLTARGRYIAELNATKIGDETYIDVDRRVTAIEKGTDESPIADEIVNAHVDYGKLIDQEGMGSSSAEVMLYRVDNPDYNTWRMDANVWGDNALKPIDETRIPIWRIDVEWADEDKAYQDILDANEGVDESTATKNYLTNNTEYRLARQRRKAYEKEIPDELIEPYVGYYEVLFKGPPKEWVVENGILVEKTQSPWFEEDWYLLDNPELYKAMVQMYKDTYGKEGWEPKTYRGSEDDYWGRIPPRDIFEMWLVYDSIIGTKHMSGAEAKKEYRRNHPRFDAWGVIYDLWKPIEGRGKGVTTRAEQQAEAYAKKRAEIERLKEEIEQKLQAMSL